MDWPLYPDYLEKTAYLYYRTFQVSSNWPPPLPYSAFRNATLPSVMRFSFEFASHSFKNSLTFEAHLQMAEQIFFWARQLNQQPSICLSQAINLVLQGISIMYLFEKGIFLKLKLEVLYYLCLSLFSIHNINPEVFITFYKACNFNSESPSITCFSNYDFSGIINQ